MSIKKLIIKKKYRNKKAIGEMFDLYATEIYDETDTNKKLMADIVKMQDKLFKQLTEEQAEQFEEIFTLQNKYSEEIDRKIFIYAFSLATELILESIS